MAKERELEKVERKKGKRSKKKEDFVEVKDMEETAEDNSG